MTRTRLYLVRHAETLANRELRFLGARDDALSDHGEEQARAVAAALERWPWTALYTSPLLRARRTAEVIGAARGVTPRTLAQLVEQSFGAWEGLTADEVVARGDAEALTRCRRDPGAAPPEGEAATAVRARVIDAIGRIVASHHGEAVVVVSHVGPIKALLGEAMGAPPGGSDRLFLDPATVSVVDWGARPVVRLVNSHSHLGWEHPRWLVR